MEAKGPYGDQDVGQKCARILIRLCHHEHRDQVGYPNTQAPCNIDNTIVFLHECDQEDEIIEQERGAKSDEPGFEAAVGTNLLQRLSHF